MKVSVIFPSYNEAASIGAAVDAVPEGMEIIVVDNNSTDRTGEIARERGAHVVVEKKQGYGAAIRRGFEEATGDIITVYDPDGQYPADKLEDAIAYLHEHNLDFVSCNRFPLMKKASLPRVRRWGNAFFTIMTNILFGTNIQDSQSGMWVFKKHVLKKLKLKSYDMPLSEEIKIRAEKHSDIAFDEFHIPYEERMGDSKLAPIKHGLKNLFFLFTLRIELWRTNKEERKRFAFGVGVLAVLGVYLFFALQHISDPFIHISSDVNGGNGIAAANLAEYGVWEMGFGLYGRLTEDPSVVFGGAYTHHPLFFLMPTVVLYKVFGVSEAMTRLGPFLVIAASLALFAFALRALTKKYLFPLFSILVFALLPGAIFYGTTLELAVFSVPAAFATLSFFIFMYKTQSSFYTFLFYASIFVGGMVGWFYYFLPASIWLFLLLLPEGKEVKNRTKHLIAIPALLVGTFLLNMLHFYILNGPFWKNLWSAFETRTERISFAAWWYNVERITRAHFNTIFLITGALGLLLSLIRFKKDTYMRFMLVLVSMCAGVTIVFWQWITHPFGMMFLWAVVAVYSGYLLSRSVDVLKMGSVVVIGTVLVIGVVTTIRGLNFFYDNLQILKAHDIELIQELSSKVEDGDVCMGRDNRGISTVAIAEWYLGKQMVEAPHCFDTDASVAIVLNPQIDEFQDTEMRRFNNHGFWSVGCAHYYCLLVTEDTVLVE